MPTDQLTALSAVKEATLLVEFSLKEVVEGPVIFGLALLFPGLLFGSELIVKEVMIYRCKQNENY